MAYALSFDDCDSAPRGEGEGGSGERAPTQPTEPYTYCTHSINLPPAIDTLWNKNNVCVVVLMLTVVVRLFT